MGKDISIVPFACTMCGACAKRCISGNYFHEYDYPTKFFEGIREMFVEQGRVPDKISETLRSLQATKNAWRLPKEARIEWEKKCEISIPDYRKEQNEFLLFVGDTSLMPETQHIPGVVAELLRLGGVDFGTFKEAEVDSGNEAREIGETFLMKQLAEENIDNFKRFSVKKIIAISPHDYHTFVHDYPNLGMKFDGVYHYTQVIDDLIREGKIALTKKIKKTVTFQDPCHLGRYNDVYDPPRDIIRGIPGVKLSEMKRNFDEGFCCGGGGGRMWYEPETFRKERISDIRVRHANEAGADVIVTSCPYCLSMLKAAGNLGEISVKDIGELVLESVKR
jgi:Fe-S oxidoreductase